MKVLHLIQKPQLRGAEVFASQLSTHLEEAGHQAILVSVFAGPAALPFGGKVYALNASQSHRFTDVKAWKKLAAIIESEKPDVIQANAGDTLKYAAFSKLLFGWKQPVIFRNASMISLYIKSKLIRLFNAFLFSKVELVISVSNSSAEDFVKLFPALKNHIITIPVGIEVNEAVATGKNTIPTLQGNPKLIHVGGFSFEKNHAGLLSVFERIIKKMPGALLHLVGDGPLKQQTQSLVEQKGLKKQVVFHGYQKQPLSFIRQADALLLPSIIEGLPGVVLEAFYCKTPVIAYDTGGIGEVVINNKTGYLIPKQNEVAFADAVESALNNSEEINRFIANAYQLVTTQYMNDDIAVKFVKAYQTITNKQAFSTNKVLQPTKNVIQNDYI
ncbi:glycosyltransferase family 4 protein [Ilyomonas limi]|uniref:Glycosyltransferase family 4 protein n=1 Tax=Ilyomonas limi TaxID=2575867 RepID=A0A4U3KVI2_9BACT|nr:glycosyltransferase family 4 protein [Ilyomonas limi]TKK65027.1 glycosyltransferase family 4 protein [Ilyomonas limi]